MREAAERKVKSILSAFTRTSSMRDYYDILDLSLGATAEQIRAAYLFHIKAFHPDKFAPGTDHARNAHRRTKEIIEAYGVLSKPHFRAEYDFRKYTGPKYAVLQSSQTVGSGRKDETQRSRNSRFQIFRDRKAILQLRILGPIAALIIVSLVAWLLRKHQPKTDDTAWAQGPWLTHGNENHFVVATRQSEVSALDENSTGKQTNEEKDRREAARVGEFKASREAHVAWELEQKRDYRNAVKLYQDAAAFGNPDAETNLAKLYLRGKGVGRDDNRARALLEKAAAQGHEEAQRILNALSVHLTP